MKFRYDGSRQLQINFEDDHPSKTETLLVIASSETGNQEKNSKTWNFLDPDGKRVRIQIQEWR